MTNALLDVLGPRRLVRGERSTRIVVLLGAIIVLSAADLAVTLIHLRTIGMAEANPIAVFLIETTSSPWSLAALKVLTVGICVTLLYRLRESRFAEIAAWTALAILVGLCVRWQVYTSEIVSDSQQLLLARSGELGTDWIVLD